MTNDLQASLEAARPPAQMTPEQEHMLRTLAPQIGGLEGALLRLLLGCYDAQAPVLAAAEAWVEEHVVRGRCPSVVCRALAEVMATWRAAREGA